MGKRAYNDHLVKRELPRADGIYTAEGWCGERLWHGNRTVNPDSHRTCPKCSAAYWGDHLKRNPNGYRLGEALSDDEKAAAGSKWTYRFVRPILDHMDRLIGWVAMPGGWGNPWKIVRLNDWSGGAAPTFGFAEGSYRSKEHALTAVPEMVEKGRLKDFQTVQRELAEKAERQRQADAEREQERRQRQVEREAREAAERQARAERLDGLRSIQSRAQSGDFTLTNHESVALAEAIAALETT